MFFRAASLPRSKSHATPPLKNPGEDESVIREAGPRVVLYRNLRTSPDDSLTKQLDFGRTVEPLIGIESTLAAQAAGVHRSGHALTDAGQAAVGARLRSREPEACRRVGRSLQGRRGCERVSVCRDSASCRRRNKNSWRPSRERRGMFEAARGASHLDAIMKSAVFPVVTPRLDVLRGMRSYMLDLHQPEACYVALPADRLVQKGALTCGIRRHQTGEGIRIRNGASEGRRGARPRRMRGARSSRSARSIWRDRSSTAAASSGLTGGSFASGPIRRRATTAES